MTRTESQYRRLEHLEAEFMSALVVELQKEATGVHSPYFTRKRAFIADGKKYRDEETASIERLEKEIEALRRSLGEPLPGGVLGLPQEFTSRLSDATNPWKGSQVALAREILSRAEAQQIAAGDVRGRTRLSNGVMP